MSGRRAPKTKVKLESMHQLDKRTAAAKHLLKFRAVLVAARGGDPSPPQLELIEMIMLTRANRVDVQHHMYEMDSLVDKRRHRVKQIVFDAMKLEEHEMKLLVLLGLERVAKQVTIEEHLASQGLTLAKPNVPAERTETEVDDDEESDDAERRDVPGGDG